MVVHSFGQQLPNSRVGKSVRRAGVRGIAQPVTPSQAAVARTIEEFHASPAAHGAAAQGTVEWATVCGIGISATICRK